MENSGRHKRRTVREAIADVSDKGHEMLNDVFLVHTVGRDEFVLENYKGILEYNDRCVRIKTRQAVVKVNGECLELRNMSDAVLCINGQISSIIFENN